MKHKIYTLIAFLSIGFMAMAQTTKPKIALTPSGTPKMHIPVEEFDFGNITEGEVVTKTFTFVNEGTAPLIISDIHTPCGCTTPTYSREPVEPGKSGEIKVQFNSTGKSGIQAKTISIRYNSDQSPASITIKGNVVKPTPTVESAE